MKKKLLIGIMTLCMVLSIAPVAVFAAEGTTAPEAPAVDLTINTLDELKAFRDAVNGGDNYAGKVVQLAADIDLASEPWTPIGVFHGTFDGGNKTISNLVVNGASNEQGLFGKIDGKSKIANLNIKNAKVTGAGCVGVAVGLMPHATTSIDNIHITGLVEVTGAGYYVGGVTGGYYGSITNCSIIGDDGSFVQNNDLFTGGITSWAGFNDGYMEIKGCTVKNLKIASTASKNDVAGIVGYVCNVELLDENGVARLMPIADCTVENVVIESNSNYAAGIGGEIYRVAISNCNVKNTTINGYTGVGGIGGYVGIATVDNCNVDGLELNANDQAGGILGQYNGATITNCTVDHANITSVIGAAGIGGNVLKAGEKITGCTVNNSIITTTSEEWQEVGAAGIAGNLKADVLIEDCHLYNNVIWAYRRDSWQAGVFSAYYTTGGNVVRNCTSDCTTVYYGTGENKYNISNALTGNANGTDSTLINSGVATENCTIKSTVAYIGEKPYSNLKEVYDLTEENGTIELVGQLNAKELEKLSGGKHVKVVVSAPCTLGAEPVVLDNVNVEFDAQNGAAPFVSADNASSLTISGGSVITSTNAIDFIWSNGTYASNLVITGEGTKVTSIGNTYYFMDAGSITVKDGAMLECKEGGTFGFYDEIAPLNVLIDNNAKVLFDGTAGAVWMETNEGSSLTVSNTSSLVVKNTYGTAENEYHRALPGFAVDANKANFVVDATSKIMMTGNTYNEEAYDKIDFQKSAVIAPVEETVTEGDVEVVYAVYTAINTNDVENANALIEAIGEVTENSKPAIDSARRAYNNLSTNAKAKVVGLDKLETAEAKYAELVAQAEVDKVDGLITAIGEVTLDSKEAIETARNAYDALTETAKAKIKNLKVLEDAEAKYEALVSDAAEAKAVEDLITAIGDVTENSKPAIDAARNAYNALSETAKSFVANLKVLEDAEAKFESLKSSSVEESENVTGCSSNIMMDGFAILGIMMAVASIRLISKRKENC